MNRLSKPELSLLAYLWNGGWVYIHESSRACDADPGAAFRDEPVVKRKGYKYADTLTGISPKTVQGLLDRGLVREGDGKEHGRLLLVKRPSVLLIDLLRILDSIVRDQRLGRIHNPLDHSFVKDEAKCARCKLRRQVENLLKEIPL